MEQARIKSATIACLLFIALQGCGGGGGGSSSSSDVAPPPDTNEPAPLTLTGLYTEVGYTNTADGEVTGFTNLPDDAQSTASLEFNDDGTIAEVTIQTSNTTATWDAASGEIIEDGPIVGLVNTSEIGIFINPIDVGWAYQTFGVWITADTETSGNAGAMTIGQATVGSAIPTTGTATFTGITSGLYVDPTGMNQDFTVGTTTANVNFIDRSVALSTSGTSTIDIATGARTSAPNLDMTGTLKYDSGKNSFTGAVTATNLEGTSTGQFYGAAAEELGGTFSLSSDSGVEKYIGGYGAKK